MSNRTVSVIIPCYNAEQWVQKQIDAVLAQLEWEDELVLVDNRSTDGTRGILDAAAEHDPRVRVISASERAGVNHARNTGLAAASKDILLICDADDLIHKGWVASFREALRDGGLGGGCATPVDEAGQRVGPDLRLSHVLGGPPYPMGGNMGLTREVLDAVVGFDESFAGGHDETDFAWRAHEAGWTARFVPGARIDYLQRPNARATVRQRRSYGRTSVLLWTRHPETAGQNAVSLHGALLHLITAVPLGLKTLLRRASLEEAADWGWKLGVAEGHLRYRLLKRIPAPLIPAGASAPQP